MIQTCERINEFLLCAPITDETNAEDIIRHRSPSHAIGNIFTGAKKHDEKFIKFNPLVNMETYTDENNEGMPYTFHQNVLRSSSTHVTLIEALNIDYNISFKGSICSSDEKIESRRILVEVQSMLIKTLGMFVKGNERNQNIIFKHLIKLRKHMGPLKL